MLLFLFVDDMQVAFNKLDEKEWEEQHLLLKKRFNITNLGESRFMLGMRITRDRVARTIKLDQELYITKALERFGLSACKTTPTPGVQMSSKSTTPIKVDSRLSQSDSPLLVREGDEKSKQPIDVLLYQEKVGVALAVRSDIDTTRHCIRSEQIGNKC